MIDLMTAPGGRIGRRDVVITGVVSLWALVLMQSNMADDAVEMSALGIPLFLGVTIPLLWRRTAPMAALSASLVALVVHDLLFGIEPIRCGVVLPTTFLLVYSAGKLLDAREARISLAIGLCSILAESITFFGPFGAVFGAVTAVFWGIGRLTRSRVRMADELSVRTAELRKARDDRARLEVATARTRLSAELEELVQRRLGELARLAGEGAASQDPAAATAVLVDIETESRETLEQMRVLVRALREEESAVPTTPQPTLTHLDAMLVRAKGGGAHLTVEGNPRALPPAVELSAFRIVEHLLGALDDAPGVDVRVRFGDDALDLAVRGPSHRRDKEAIARARERVELHRGTLRATVRGGRAEALVSLPLVVEA